MNYNFNIVDLFIIKIYYYFYYKNLTNKYMSDLNKLWMNSLILLDNQYINFLIIFLLVLYNLLLFNNINIFIASLFNLSIIRIIFLFLIIYIAPKDPIITILLAISYIITIDYINDEDCES